MALQMISLLLRRFVLRMAEASAKRVTGDEPQGTMGRVQTAGEAPSRPLSPSRLPLRAHRERRLGTRQANDTYEGRCSFNNHVSPINPLSPNIHM